MSDAAKEWDERYRQGRGMPDEPSPLLVGNRAMRAEGGESPRPANRYDLIINFHYLQRSLAGPIVQALKRGGVLFFESFTIDQLQYGYGPKDPAFLVRPGELKELVAGLEALLYHEGVMGGDRGPQAVAPLIARKRRAEP